MRALRSIALVGVVPGDERRQDDVIEHIIEHALADRSEAVEREARAAALADGALPGVAGGRAVHAAQRWLAEEGEREAEAMRAMLRSEERRHWRAELLTRRGVTTRWVASWELNRWPLGQDEPR